MQKAHLYRQPSLRMDASALQNVLAEKISEVAVASGTHIMTHHVRSSLIANHTVAAATWFEPSLRILKSPHRISRSAVSLFVNLPFRASKSVARVAYQALAPEALTSTIDWYNEQVARSEANQSALSEIAPSSESGTNVPSESQSTFDGSESDLASNEGAMNSEEPVEPQTITVQCECVDRLMSQTNVHWQ